jgi:hypothetical protein
MKTSSTMALSLALALVGTRTPAVADTSQNTTNVPGPTPYEIVSAGPNQNLWQCQSFYPLPDGGLGTNTLSYLELASGLNIKNPTNGGWQPAQATIEAYAGGAIVRHCQHEIIFANNLNSAGSVDLQTPDGKELKSNLLGLLYVDPTTGQTAQIAQVQDSDGELVGEDEVLYPNAFSGVAADILYKNRLDGMEQNVILKEQLPPPASVGIDSQNSQDVYLEVFTEFLTPPPARVFEVATNVPGNEADQAVCWGKMSLGRGKAFSLGTENSPANVIKKYVNVDGRFFLLELVRLSDIQAALSQLPEHASNLKGRSDLASRHFKFPRGPAAKSAARPMRLALGGTPDKGYVLDYTSLSTSYTNFCFQGDTEYYISSALNLSDSGNSFEGGTLIKMAANASINFTAGSSFTFSSGPYRPIVFSAKDDNSIGQTISGSTGSPSGYYGNPVLNLNSMGSVTLSDFRMLYANRGISAAGATPAIYDAQFVDCAMAVSDLDGSATLENVLLSGIKTNFNLNGSSGSIYVQNATFNNAFDLVDGTFSGADFNLTNCVFVNVTNLSGNIFAGYNGFYRAPSVGASAVTNLTYPLQSAGSASCYLTNTCAFLNAGASNVDSVGLQLIQAKTTYVPVIYSNTTISVATTLGPQAQRDHIGNPSLGYHYDPLDYVFGATITQSNLTFSAGTAAGFFYNSSGGTYGLAVGDSAAAIFAGTVTAPCRWARQWTVQEGGNGNWTAASYLGGITGQSYSHAAPAILAQFTDFYELAVEGNLFRDNYTLLVMGLKNCELYSGGYGGYAASVNLTNCLSVNCSPGIFWNYGANNLYLENCSSFRGQVEGNNTTSNPWPVYIANCAFDSTTFNLTSSGNTNGYYTDYNSFLAYSNTTPYLGGHEVTVAGGYNWETSHFGNYYLPYYSPLIQAGSTTADRVGLYHFTTQISEVPETNAVVDIGYHYVAVDEYGNPLDTNGDGVPDYLEDANGNGLVDSGEIGWNIVGDRGLTVTISRPRPNSVVP